MTEKEDYGTEVRLLAITGLTDDFRHVTGVTKTRSQGDCYPYNLEETEALIEFAGRKCYANEDNLGTNPDWIQSRIRDGHESILEHASATFHIKCSRVVTHELVRHRIASYSQRSQRYIDESKPRYITPPELSERGPGKLFYEVMERCWAYYALLLKEGVPREIARYVLPNACETQIVATMNLRELRHFIRLRASKRALPEMQEVANKIRNICKQLAPKVFEDV